MTTYPTIYRPREDVTLYRGDCLTILPTLTGVDCIVTDPPYPDYHAERYQYNPAGLEPLRDMPCRQLVFWSAKVDFPMPYTAVHIWDKRVGVASQYERIFERNGQANYKLWAEYFINSTVAASYTQDVFCNHPSQKPERLIRKLVAEVSDSGALVLDPYMGSGTTGIACIRTGRRFIGIEIDPTHYATACKRIDNELQQMTIPMEAAKV